MTGILSIIAAQGAAERAPLRLICAVAPRAARCVMGLPILTGARVIRVARLALACVARGRFITQHAQRDAPLTTRRAGVRPVRRRARVGRSAGLILQVDRDRRLHDLAADQRAHQANGQPAHLSPARAS